MPDPSAVVPSVVIFALLAVMLWFALGTQRNVRTGNEILAWLQRALPALGRRTTLRWLGSSAVELRLVEPLEPFRDLTILAVLEPRDVPWLWAVARRRGRRDFLIFRGALRSPPRFALEIADRRGWTGGDEPRATDEEAWRPMAWGMAGTLSALGAAGADAGRARELWQRLERVGVPWRLSIRRTVPHLEVHLMPTGVGEAPAERFVAAIREIAIEASRG